MDEEKLPSSTDSDSDETSRIARQLHEEISSRKGFDHTWDVAVPGEEDLPLLPRLKSGDSDSDQGEGSEEQAEEPEVLIQFENQEENLLSQYDNEDYYDNDEEYGYEDQYEYDDSYAYDDAYEYEGSYDYDDPYGLNQLLQRRKSPTDLPESPGLAAAANHHHIPSPNYWMNNPPPGMIGSMQMPRFPGHMPPGPRGAILPYRAPGTPNMMTGLPAPGTSLTPTSTSGNPSPTAAEQSPQIQNMLNQASLHIQMQNSSLQNQSSLYGAGYQDPLNPNYQAHLAYASSNSAGNYQDAVSIPSVPGATPEREPPGCEDDAYSPDDPTQDESGVLESDGNQVGQIIPTFDVADIPRPQTPEKSEIIVKPNAAEVAEVVNVPSDSPKTPKPVLGKAQAKKRLMAFANKFGVLPKVQPLKAKAKVDAVVGKAETSSKQRTSDGSKTKTEKGKGKSKDKVKSLLEELNDAKLKIESALEAQQQNSSSGKSKKHHEDRVPAIEEIVREESMNKGLQDYNNSTLNAAKEISGRSSSSGKGKWKKSRYNQSDEENYHKSGPGKKFTERRRRYSKDRDRDHKSKDGKSSRDQSAHRQSQDTDPRKKEKEKSSSRDSRRKRGASKDRDRKDRQTPPLVRLSNEKEKDKEREREKEREFQRCKNWLELKKSRLSLEEIVNRRKEDRLNKIRTAQDYAEHFDQMLMVGDHHLKRYPLIVDSQEGPREFPPESVKVTKRGRGPHVLYSENPRVSLFLNRQQVYQAVPSDRRDKMRQICEANNLQINPSEEDEVEQHQGWYESIEGTKTLKKTLFVPATIVIAPLKSKWENGSPVVAITEKKDSDAIPELSSLQKDVTPENEFKEMPRIEKTSDKTEPVDNLTPDIFPEPRGKSLDRVASSTIEDVIPSPRSSRNRESKKHDSTTNKEARDSSHSSASVGDQKLVSEYEQFIKMVSSDDPAPVSTPDTIPSADSTSSLSTHSKRSLKKSKVPEMAVVSSKSGKVIEKTSTTEKSNYVEDSELENADVSDNRKESNTSSEKKTERAEKEMAAEIESDTEADASSSKEESDGSHSVPSDWENVKIKEEKLSDESFDKKNSRKKKKKRKSSSESSSSSSSSSSSESEDEEEEEEEKEKRSKKNKKKNKRKLIRKKSKKKAKSSSESDSSEDQSSDSSSEDERRKKRRRKRKTKKKAKKVIVKKKRKRRMKTDSSSSDSDRKAKRKKKKDEKQASRKQSEKKVSENEEESSKSKIADVKKTDKKIAASDRRESLNETREVKEEKIDSKRRDVASKELRKNEKEVSDRKKNGQDWDYDDNSIAIEEERESVGEENKPTQKLDEKKKVAGREKKKERSQDKFLEEWENESMRMTQKIMHDDEISKADTNKKKGKSNKEKSLEDTAKIPQEEKQKEKARDAKLLEDWDKESVRMTQQIMQSDDIPTETSDRKRKSNKSSSEWEEDEFGLTDSSNVPSISVTERVDKRREHLTDEWEVDSLEETRDSNQKKKSKRDKKIDKGIKYDKKTDTYIAIDRESVKDQRKRQNRLSAIRIWEEEEEEGEKEAMMFIKAKSKHEKKSKSKDKWETDDSGGKPRLEEEDREKSNTKSWETESRDSTVAWTEKEQTSEDAKTRNRTGENQENRLFEEYYQDRQEATDQNSDKNRGKTTEKSKSEDWLILPTEEALNSKSYSMQADINTANRYDESKNSSRKNWEDKDQEKTSDWEEAEEKSTRPTACDVSKDVLGGWVEPFDIVEADKLEASKSAEKVLQQKKDVSEPKKDKKSRWDVEDKSKDQIEVRESRKSESDNLLLIEWEEEHNEWVKTAASTYDELTVPPAFSRSTSNSGDTVSKSSSVDKTTKKSRKLDELSDSYDVKSSKRSDRAKRSTESWKPPKKSWTNEDEEGHSSLSSLIELNFTNARSEPSTKDSETKSTTKNSSKDSKDDLDLYSPSSPALSQRSEDMDISSGSDMDHSKEDVSISNIPLPSEEFPVMFGCQVASIPMPVSPPVQSSSMNSNSSIASSNTANIVAVAEKLVPQIVRAEVVTNDVVVSPKVEYENIDANLIADKEPSKWESEDSEILKKIIPEHSDKSSVSSSSADISVDKSKSKNSMDIFADYESSSDSSEKTESENDLPIDYVQPEVIKTEEKVKSPLKLIPKQILFQQTSEAKSKSQIEVQKKEAEIIQGTISFKIQKKVLQTNVLPSDDNDDTIDELEKPRKQENQFFDKKLTPQKSIIDKVAKIEAENSIPRNSQGRKLSEIEEEGSKHYSGRQSDSMEKIVPTLRDLERKEDDKYNDFPIGKRDADKNIRRSRSRTRSRSRSRSRSRDRRKKSPERRERDRWSREDRRRSRGIETREREKSGKRERLGTPTQESRNRLNTKYPERGDSRRRTSPSKGRAGGRRNRSRSPVLRRRSNERSRSRSPMARRDRERSPSKRRDGDKKIIKLDRLDEKDDKDFFKEDDMATNKFKTFDDRRERSLKSPIRYPVSSAGDDNNRRFDSVERKLGKERDRGRYRDSMERDKETIAYDPMEILREKGLEAERLRKRLQTESESRKHQWKYEGEDNGDEDDGRGLFPNEFDLDFEERCLRRCDSVDRETAEGSIHSMSTFRNKPRERSVEPRLNRSRERGRERDSPSSEGREGRSSYSRSRSPPRFTHNRGSDRYKSLRKSRSRSRTPERNLRSAKRFHRSRSTSIVRDEDDLPLNEACTTGRRIETIVQSVATVTGITGVIADSTISDSELLAGTECVNHDGALRYANNSNSNANEYYYYSEGNLTYPPRIEEPHQSSAPIGIGSPKRLSLDDRLELELGIKKKHQQIPITVQDPQHLGYHPAAFSTNIATYPSVPPTVVPPLQQSPYQQPPPKVLQVGNVLQVIPSDFAGIPPPQRDLPAVGVPSSSHVVRVGNVLQVVPSTLDWAAGPSPSDTISSVYHRPCQPVTPIGVPPPSPATLTLIPATITSPIPVPRPEIIPTAVQPVYNYEVILEERKKVRDERKRIREERRKEKDLRRTERRKRRADRLIKKNLTLRQQEGATFQLQHAPSPSPVPVLTGLEDEEDEEANSRDQSLLVCDEEQYQQAQHKPDGFEENPQELTENATEENTETTNDWLPLLPPPAKGILISPGFGRESMSNGNPGYLYEPEEDDEGLDQSEERLDLSIDSEFALSEEQVESQIQAMIDESKTKDGSVAGRSRDEDKEVEVKKRKIVRRRSRKSVQFADGVRPGEGTSPSGGEGDMPSPPPPVSTSVLPLRNSNIMNHNNLRGSEKRIKIKKSKKKHQKAKPPKTKKKVKVKIIKLKKPRVQVSSPLTIEDLDELDERSPPPPPPGSPPPPHLWPSYLAAYSGVMNTSNPIAEPLALPQALASPPPTPLPLLVPPPPLNYTIQPCNKA